MMVQQRNDIRASDDDQHDRDHGLATVSQESKPKLKKPPLYCVVMLNDDYTPMEFVVHVLQSYFSMTLEKATQVMLAVHQRGSAVCGIFTKDVAETKCQQVNQYSQENEHPLLCTVEVKDDGEN